jgi:glycosyltransferase involved in cell wall biosynthesis
LTIVLPVYNPQPEWYLNIEHRFKELKSLLKDFSLSLIIINDGSKVEINKEQISWLKSTIYELSYLEYSENQGKGYALRHAISQVKSDFVMYTDNDFPFQNSSMIEVASRLESYDLVVGIKNENYYNQLPAQRKFISKSLRRLIKIVFPKMITSDTQCGLKAMNSKGKDIFLQTTINRYLFDLEFIYNAGKAGLKCCTVPVELREGIQFSTMNNKVLIHEFKNFLKILVK